MLNLAGNQPRLRRRKCDAFVARFLLHKEKPEYGKHPSPSMESRPGSQVEERSLAWRPPRTLRPGTQARPVCSHVETVGREARSGKQSRSFSQAPGGWEGEPLIQWLLAAPLLPFQGQRQAPGMRDAGTDFAAVSPTRRSTGRAAPNPAANSSGVAGDLFQMPICTFPVTLHGSSSPGHHVINETC